MIEINLIPDVKQELIKAERVRGVVISFSILAGIIALAIVGVLAVYVFGVQTVRSALDDDAIKKGGEQLASVEDLSKVLTIQNQLSKINELNSQKKIDSRVIDVIQAVTPPAPNNIQISSLFVDNTNTRISLEGQTPTYDTLEIFKKTIDGAVITYTQDGEDKQTKLATEISTSDVSFGEDSTGAKVLRFTLSFVYTEELFSPTVPTFVVKLTNQGNVTDSYLGLPKSLFVAPAQDLEGTE